jgi:5-methylcytosine-specific restriction endonuclease McrA
MAHVTNPKPEPRAKLKARLARQHAILRRAARWQCFERDGGCCVVCGVPLHFNGMEPGATEFNTAHINEIKPRSLGGSDLDLENLNCKCPACHVGKGFHDHA